MGSAVTSVNSVNLDGFAGIMPQSASIRLKKREKGGSRPQGIYAFGTLTAGDPSAAITFDVEGEDINIISLYAAKEFRGLGLESLLLQRVFTFGLKTKGVSWINAHFLTDDDYDIREFYDNAGYYIEKGEQVFFKISVDLLAKSERFNNYNYKGIDVAFEELPKSVLSNLERKIKATGIDFIKLPLSLPEYSKKLSAAVFNGNKAVAFIVADNPNEYGVNMLYAYTTDKTGKALMELFHGSFKKIIKLYKGTSNAVIGIPAISKPAEKLIRRLTEGALVSETTSVRALLDLSGYKNINLPELSAYDLGEDLFV